MDDKKMELKAEILEKVLLLISFGAALGFEKGWAIRAFVMILAVNVAIDFRLSRNQSLHERNLSK